VKSIVAALVNLALAFLVGERLPGGGAVAATLLTGFLGYGVSIVLHMLAMRDLGAARQGTLFASAPFAGAVASIPILGERLGARELVAGVVMAAGVIVMLRAHRRHAR
jgi:drug/metabolite transporter (DMT)-like permease